MENTRVAQARLLLDLVSFTAALERKEDERTRLLDACGDELQIVRSRGLSSVPYLGLAHIPDSAAPERLVWEHQRAALLQLLAEAKLRTLDIAVLKGAEVCERLLGSHPLGLKSDVDILVAKEHEAKVRALLADLGFSQSNYDKSHGQLVACSLDELHRHEHGNYSLKSFVKLVRVGPASTDPLGTYFRYPLDMREDGLWMLVVIDVTLGLDKTLGYDALRPRLIDSALSGGRTLSLEDHYWYLCSLFYLKMFFDRDKARLSQLSEIATLLSRCGDSFDWDYVFSTARRLDLFPGLYYVTAFLHVKLGINLQPGVLSALDPRNGSRTRDFGWQFPKALGLLDDIPSLSGVASDLKSRS